MTAPRTTGMVAVFYDRKNGAEVTSDALMPINLVAHYVRCEAADDSPRLALAHLRNAPEPLGELGYRSRRCQKGRNWDRYLMASDLVFLRLEAR